MGVRHGAERASAHIHEEVDHATILPQSFDDQRIPTDELSRYSAVPHEQGGTVAERIVVCNADTRYASMYVKIKPGRVVVLRQG